jgi:hypothetical protein
MVLAAYRLHDYEAEVKTECDENQNKRKPA